MAISLSDAKFLFWSLREGHNLGKVLTLGRQRLCFGGQDAEALIGKFSGLSGDIGKLRRDMDVHPPFVDHLLPSLGARSVESLDCSDFEGATIVHDLNLPVNGTSQRFDTIIDGGTLEHIFNLPEALRTIMTLLKPGGVFFHFSGAHGFMGHGFYQFSPELFFRVFKASNGFALSRIVLYDFWKKDAPLYVVKDPDDIHMRNHLTGRKQVSICVAAKKIREERPFATYPQQSDYAAAWANGRSKPARPIRKWIPNWARQMKYRWLYHRQHGPARLSNKRHYQRASSAEIYGH